MVGGLAHLGQIEEAKAALADFCPSLSWICRRLAAAPGEKIAMELGRIGILVGRDDD